MVELSRSEGSVQTLGRFFAACKAMNQLINVFVAEAAIILQPKAQDDGVPLFFDFRSSDFRTYKTHFSNRGQCILFDWKNNMEGRTLSWY